MKKPDTVALLTAYEQFAIDQRRADKTISALRIKLMWASLPDPIGEQSPQGNPRNPDYDDTIAAMPGTSEPHYVGCMFPRWHCTCPNFD